MGYKVANSALCVFHLSGETSSLYDVGGMVVVVVKQVQTGHL